MLEDQTFTERVQQFKQPGTCIHCHASVYVQYQASGKRRSDQRLRALQPDAVRRGSEVIHARSGMHRLPRARHDGLARDAAGFIEGIRAYKASQGVSDYDVNTMATRQEMRTFVCGQCHVKYYFKGEKRLTYPWAKGLKVDQIMSTTARPGSLIGRTPRPAPRR